MIMPKDQHNSLLAELLEELEQQSMSSSEKEPLRIFLFGSVCESPLILRYFHQTGMDVVDDNLYDGTCYFFNDVQESYNLNGFIFHNDKSCKMFSIAIPEIKRIVQKTTGIPAYVLEGDHGDPRFYSQEGIKKGLTYYFELLESIR